MKINQKGKVSMSTMKSSSKVANETLDAIHNEASNEIIKKLLDRPETIVIIARMIGNAYFFSKRTARAGQLHDHQQLEHV